MGFRMAESNSECHHLHQNLHRLIILILRTGLASKICGIHVQLSWGCCSWVATLPKQNAQLCDPTPAVASSNFQLHVHRFKKQQTRQEKGCQSLQCDKDVPGLRMGQVLVTPARGPEASRLSVCPVWSLGRLVFSSVSSGFKACHVTAAKMLPGVCTEWLKPHLPTPT